MVPVISAHHGTPAESTSALAAVTLCLPAGAFPERSPTTAALSDTAGRAQVGTPILHTLFVTAPCFASPWSCRDRPTGRGDNSCRSRIGSRGHSGTPVRKGTVVPQIIRSPARTVAALCTPSPTSAGTRRSGRLRLPSTPEPKARQTWTPPSNPVVYQRALHIEIEDAVDQASPDLLQLALARSKLFNGRCLYEAVARGNVRALEILLRHRVEDVDEQWHGLRPLHLALRSCVDEGDEGFRMSELLLRCGAQPNRIAGDELAAGQDTPLHEAVRRGCAAAVALLLRHGADVNACDAAGNSPLHAVAQQPALWSCHRAESVAVLLLRGGASPVCVNAAKRLPSHYAREELKARLLAAESHWARRRLLVAMAGASRPARHARAAATAAGAWTPREGRSCGGVEFVALLPEVLEAITAFL